MKHKSLVRLTPARRSSSPSTCQELWHPWRQGEFNQPVNKEKHWPTREFGGQILSKLCSTWFIQLYYNKFRFNYRYCFKANILYSLSNKALDAFSKLKSSYLSSSKLKCLRFSALDSLCLNEAKLLCLVLITFINNFQFT